jgi:hypothetical protein
MNIESISEEQIKAFLQNEVVWYYSDDTDFKGPFTDTQIIHSINNDTINSSAKMWSKKYDFWIPILEIKKFATVLESKPVAIKAPEKTEAEKNTEKEFSWKNSDEFWKYMDKKHPHLHYKPITEFEMKGEERPHARPVWIGVATGFIVSILLGLTYYSNFGKSEIAHNLLNKQQNNEAQIIKQSDLTKYGIRAQAFFTDQSSEDLNIVIATNLKDESIVKLKLEAVPDTLVGGFEYSLNQEIHIKNGFAEITNLRQLMQGEYVLIVQCIECLDVHVSNEAILYREKIFLGGTKNKQYDLSLLRYHVDLRNQVREELDNLNQIDDALNSQFTTLINGRIDNMWHQMQSQLDVEHAKLSEQNAKGKFFYHEILAILNKNFFVLKSAQADVNRKKTEEFKKDFMLNSALIKRATNEMIKMPLTANGMPQKSSL